MYQVERDLFQMISIEIKYQLKVFVVKTHLVHEGEQMHEHIAYELRYGYFVQQIMAQHETTKR